MIRQWFHSQNVLEVETPNLALAAVTDPHIESFAVAGSHQRYLRTSAEFHLKRLLAAGSGDIYELGKVFRVDESGRYHNPEFTMLEWYRCGMDHHALINDVQDLLCHLHHGELPGFDKISYRDLWLRESALDIASVELPALITFLTDSGCEVPEAVADDLNSVLDLGMGTVIADSLPEDRYTCIYEYPASQASLARIDRSDRKWPVARRFEIYFGSVELANGYHELSDASEQLARFREDNSVRERARHQTMPIDNRLIASLSNLPDCAGVAIGVDRLLMALLPEVTSLQQVLSFDWERA